MVADDDAVFEEGLERASDPRWNEFFAFDVTRADVSDETGGFLRWYELAYELGIVQQFAWTEWLEGSGRRFVEHHDRDVASVADAVRVITSIVRADRTNEGHVFTEMGDGLVTAAIRRLWCWYRERQGNADGFVDVAEYSEDLVYRWSFERRWNVGGTLCWIGLNPGTGDTDSKKRPTLTKVCRLADSMGLAAVLVVNLFAFRSTDPKSLRRAPVDIVGNRNDETIQRAVGRSTVTLAAWGAGGKLGGRGAAIAARHSNTMCLGTTRGGEPRHPLYVARAVKPTPYHRPP